MRLRLIVAVLVAKEAAAVGVETFTFISAAANFPGVPSRYISSKRYHQSVAKLTFREAETAISQIEGLRSIFIRPGIPSLAFNNPISQYVMLMKGLMFSNHDRPHLAPLEGIISTIAGINSRLGGALPFMGAAGVPPLDVEVVARAVISATLEPRIKGVVGVETLSRLGTA